MKRILVTGAGGFIGGHLVKRLKSEGHWIRGVDLKTHEFTNLPTDEFIIGDLRNPNICDVVTKDINECYTLAADMGGAGYTFTGENDADIMHNSALINLNITYYARKNNIEKIFYSSSACTYPKHNQEDPNNPNCEESSVYPADPDSEYGWEKIFSERLYQALQRNYGIETRIARFHNTFGEQSDWNSGREKAPAAICRKVAEAPDGGEIEIWGGEQTRSFVYINECIEGIRRLMESDVTDVLNIGSEELISINNLAKMVIKISGKNLSIKNVAGPIGIMGRNSNNKLIEEKLGWKPTRPLEESMIKLYSWIETQVKNEKI